jgi:integrase
MVEAQRAQLVERSPRLKPSTIKNYKREDRSAQKFFGRKQVLVRFDPETETELEEELRDCLLRDLTRTRIEEWIRFRLDTCGPATMNRDLARLRMVMRWAEREGWLKGGNPINQIPQLRELEGVIRWLDDHEEARLQEACASQPWLWRMIEFSIWTGLRRGEQLGLRWDQIRKGLIEVRSSNTKGGRPRWIPITETIGRIINEQRADPSHHRIWVFPNLKGRNRWNPFNFYKKWDAVRRQAGLEDYRWHDNRHTFCSRLVQEGIPLEQIQILAGHRDLKMTQRYAHLAPTHLRGPMNALEERKRRLVKEMASAPWLPKEQPEGATQAGES